MKFIFPTNYNFKPKLFGILDYSTAILNIIWNIFIFCLLNLLFVNLTIKVFLFISLSFPLLLFSIIGFNHENIIYVFLYLLKFFVSRKIYLYKK
jgi:hypothetical protein